MVALRTLLLLLVIAQTSGVVRAAGPLWATGGDCSEPCADRDEEGGECSPACPTCTCSHAGRSTIARVAPVDSLPIFAADVMCFVEPFTTLPSPPRRGVFHPPRA